MARSLSVVIKNPSGMGQPGKMNTVIIDWTADSAGGVSGELAATAAIGVPAWKTIPSRIVGTLKQVQTIPGLNGDLTTTRPTGGYGIVLLDQYGYDIAHGALAGRSGTVAEVRDFRDVSGELAQEIFVDSPITFKATSAGNGGSGRTILIFAD